ncbi:hypothetical protein D3C72_1775910 [compost metagenome]
MRVILTDHITDDTGRLLVGSVPVVVKLVHRKQHAPVHRFQAVPHIRKRPAHDHAHGVIEIGAAHFLFEGDRKGFFCEWIHCGVVYAAGLSE